MYRFFSKKRGFLNILLKNPYLGMHRSDGAAAPYDAGRALGRARRRPAI